MMPTTIRLNPDTEARLNQLAAKTGRTKAFYLRRLIEEHLDDIEDAYLADQALAEFRASGEKAIPFDEVCKELGLDD